MDDEGDFKKARGFLLTYSALVLALWYFGADLTQFKLMGNEIKLQHRTESAWLVLAIINLYFWFRCYQRVPPLGLYFDEPMNSLYDSALIWSASWRKRLELNKKVQKSFADEYQSEGTIQIHSPTGEITASDAIKRDRRRERDWEKEQKRLPTNEQKQFEYRKTAPELYRLSRVVRTEIVLRRSYSHIGKEGSRKENAGGAYVEYHPHVLFTWLVKAFTIVRGIFVTPWFTDHIAPLVLGGISTILALCKWYSINFCTADHPYAAMLCGL
ncbi:hypothetical protein HBO23_06685 [Pseudomonas sp. WS 5532]|uniref:hypothetical protein n=1 Tax=unclassified Pseudomonas TaxID=196821 RepID=UPI0014726F11|nr:MULTISPECIES: hypothetical protein [unclassified Pseudomonas]NMX72649.1 hypothetical protein [Pseudomonas sp. WS 5532]QXI58818.1 hypothetical protein HU759_027755 [Pseudomonas sp. OE 28.3]